MVGRELVPAERQRNLGEMQMRREVRVRMGSLCSRCETGKDVCARSELGWIDALSLACLLCLCLRANVGSTPGSKSCTTETGRTQWWLCERPDECCC